MKSQFFVLIFSIISLNLNAMQEGQNIEKISLGAGCFWCVEAVYQELDGVISATSGYMGGLTKNPSYKEVCSGLTGHAEVIAVEFDNTVISLAEILEVFFQVHNPTTLNRQGNDVGTQYRSGIYFTEVEQHTIAETIIKQLEAEGVFDSPIVTEVKAATPFYKAEEDHVNYYNQNKTQPYCTIMIDPKIEKLKNYFTNYITLKNE